MKSLSAAFGLLMIVTAAGGGGPIVLTALGLAALAVAIGVIHTRAAGAAVLLTIIALALSQPSALFAAVSGMSATVYLLTRHADGAITLTTPTVAGLLGFTVVGLAATAVELPVNWIPLLAPVVMAAILIVAALPLLADERVGALHNPSAEDDTSG